MSRDFNLVLHFMLHVTVTSVVFVVANAWLGSCLPDRAALGAPVVTELSVDSVGMQSQLH